MITKIQKIQWTLEKAQELLCLLEEIERCNRAIDQYAKCGLSDTIHDFEHREIRAKAQKRLEELEGNVRKNGDE